MPCEPSKPSPGTAVSPPAGHGLCRFPRAPLSRHVIALESMLNTQLFERRPHALTLTGAGQHLLPTVTKAFDRIEYALEEIRQGPATDGAYAAGAIPVQFCRAARRPAAARLSGA